MTSNIGVSRFETVSSGPNTRKFVGLSRRMSRSKLPRTLVGSASLGAGLLHFDGVAAEVGDVQRLADQAAVRRGVGADPPRAGGGKVSQLGDKAAGRVEELLRLVDSASTAPGSSGARGSRGRPPSAPGATARTLRGGGRRPRAGPVQPFGLRRTIIGQGGRRATPVCAGVLLDRADLRRRSAPASRPSPGACSRARSPRRSTACSRTPRTAPPAPCG